MESMDPEMMQKISSKLGNRYDDVIEGSDGFIINLMILKNFWF